MHGVAGVMMGFESDLRLEAESMPSASHITDEAGVSGKAIKGVFLCARAGRSGSASDGVACAAGEGGGLLLAPNCSRALASRSPPVSAVPSRPARCTPSRSVCASFRCSPPAPSTSSTAAACLPFVCAARRRGETHNDDPAEDTSESSPTSRAAAPSHLLEFTSNTTSSTSDPPPARHGLSPQYPETPASHKSAPSASCRGGR